MQTLCRNWVKYWTFLLTTNATLYSYHTDLYRRLFVMVSWHTARKSPQHPVPRTWKMKSWASPFVQWHSLNLFVHRIPWRNHVLFMVQDDPDLSGWWSGHLCVSVNCRVVSFPGVWALMLLYMTLQCLFGLTHVRFLTVWFCTANPRHHMWHFVLWCCVFHSHKAFQSLSRGRAEGCRYSELAIHFYDPLRHPSYVRDGLSCGLFPSLLSVGVFDCFGVIRTLYHRANKIVSNTDNIRKEKENIQTVLHNCGYPRWAGWFQKAKKKISNTDTQKGLNSPHEQPSRT